MSGLLITLEGIDGCGKSTQARLLADWLKSQGHRVCPTREPGGTCTGERLRDLVLDISASVTAEAELFIYLADRCLHVSQVVRPALEQGAVVVCERYTDSTLAYQGYGRGLDLSQLRRLNELATGGLEPDLTIVLGVPPDKARLDEQRLDRLESEGLEFRARVAEGFRELAAHEPDRIRVVDGMADIETVHGEIVSLATTLWSPG